ncbi:MAG: ABC transporter permease [Planctomycetota bacterium]
MPALLPLAKISLWLTPVWLLALGVAIGAAVVVLLWLVLWFVNRATASSVLRLVRESVLAPISYVVIAYVTILVVATPAVLKDRIVESIRRLGAVSDQAISVTLDPRTENYEVPISFRSDELRRYDFSSDQDVIVSSEPDLTYSAPVAIVQGGDEAYAWSLSSKSPRRFAGEVEAVYLTNEGDAPANVTMAFDTEVRVPEVHDLPIVAGSVVGLFLFYVLLHFFLPGVSNIALATAKEASSQPLFLLFLGVGAVLLLVYIILPYNTFGEDVKILKQSGLETIMILAISFAVWTASVSVADEIDGKTALTLLSKPISRRQFVFGKFLGIVSAVAVIFVVLGALLLTTVSYKVVYDARETSNPTPAWQECYGEMVQITPGLVLAFFETTALAAVSVAISTRLPMLPNLIICGSIYVLGHLTPLIAQSSVGELPFVQFFAKLFAVILPELDHFNIQAAVAAGQAVPFTYLAWAGLYCLAYCTFALLLALILFEDRDLA